MSFPSNKKSLAFHLKHAIKDRAIECVIFLIAGSVGGFINRRLFTEHFRPTVAIIAIYGVASILWAFKKYRSDKELHAHLDRIAESDRSNHPYQGMFSDPPNQSAGVDCTHCTPPSADMPAGEGPNRKELP